MTEVFNALMIREAEKGTTCATEQISESDLPDLPLKVRIEYSCLNYKDGLAICGKGIARKLPMVGGIDLVGAVIDTGGSEFAEGDRIIVNGFGLSEVHWGGYSQQQNLDPAWAVRCPDGISSVLAMSIGTAGYTAMLSVMELQAQGVTPDSGEIIVTGAAGGVGSVAVSLLAKLGYQVVASTGRESTCEYLRQLGASDVISRSELSEGGKPFQKERWAGAIDTVGSTTLANLIAQAKYGATITCCGLAGGMDLPATVMPFILRGVRLSGIDSVMAAKAKREEAWQRLATDLDFDHLDIMSRVKPMSTLPELGSAILAGQVQGRVVIDVNA